MPEPKTGDGPEAKTDDSPEAKTDDGPKAAPGDPDGDQSSRAAETAAQPPADDSAAAPGTPTERADSAARSEDSGW